MLEADDEEIAARLSDARKREEELRRKSLARVRKKAVRTTSYVIVKELRIIMLSPFV
jgi:hypothetical protein